MSKQNIGFKRSNITLSLETQNNYISGSPQRGGGLGCAVGSGLFDALRAQRARRALFTALALSGLCFVWTTGRLQLRHAKGWTARLSPSLAKCREFTRGWQGRGAGGRAANSARPCYQMSRSQT